MRVVITGLGRSGTTAMAGAVERLGVSLGATEDKNYEERVFGGLMASLHRQGDDMPGWEQQIREYVTRRDAHQANWAVKDIHLAVLWRKVLPIFQPDRVIICLRDLESCRASHKSAFGGENTTGRGPTVSEKHAGLFRLRQEWSGLLRAFRYPDFVDDARGTIRVLADFLDVPVSNDAVEFLDPERCHHRPGRE